MRLGCTVVVQQLREVGHRRCRLCSLDCARWRSVSGAPLVADLMSSRMDRALYHLTVVQYLWVPEAALKTVGARKWERWVV